MVEQIYAPGNGRLTSIEANLQMLRDLDCQVAHDAETGRVTVSHADSDILEQVDGVIRGRWGWKRDEDLPYIEQATTAKAQEIERRWYAETGEDIYNSGGAYNHDRLW